MSTDEKIRNALLTVAPALPVMNGVFESDEDAYYVFTVDTLGAGYADDAPGAERELIGVHLFAPLNEDITERKRATKKALFDAGFTWPSAEDDSDGTGRHIYFACENVSGVSTDGLH